MNHMITTYGGGEAFYYVFEGIATVLGSGGFMNNLFRLGGMLGVFWVFILAAFRNAYEQAFFWFFWFMAASLILFTPKATVWMKDPLTFTAPRKVDNVPLALAVMAGTASSLGTALTEKLESVFTLPDYMPYHETGTVFASRLLQKAHFIKITDPDFRANMERFVNRCVVYDAMIGYKYTLKDLQRSDDVWGLVSSKASPLLGFLYKEPGKGKRGEIITCRKGAENLQKLWESQIKEASLLYGSHFFRKEAKAGQQMFLAYLPQSFQLLTKTAMEAPKILQQEMMLNAITEGSRHKLDELKGSVSYAAAKVLIQQEINNRTMGEIAGEVLVIAKAVIEALCYASFIFVMMLSLLHQGYRVLWNYAGVLLWLQLWAPLYAVLNLFITLYAQYRSSGLLGHSGLTLLTSAGLAQMNAQAASMAGWLSCSLPFLSYAIVKSGVGSFMNIAGNLISSAQSAVGAAAGEAASGNISLANVSMGTTALQNMTAFQRTTAPSYKEGHFERMLDDGTIVTTQGDGSQVFRSGAGLNTSTLRLKVNSSENLAERAEEQISHQNAVLQAQSEEYASTRMEAARKALTLASSSGKSESGSDGYDSSTSVTQNKALSQAQRFSKTLQDQFQFSERQAMDITASLMAGTPKWLPIISADIKSSGSTSASREKMTQDIQNLANEMGVTHSLDEATRSVKDSKYSDAHSKEARLASDIGTTMEKADTLRSAMSKTQQAIDSYSKVQSFSKTGAFNVDRDESQQLLEFTADQTIQGRRIGMEGAYRLLNTGGYQAEAMVSAFRESRWEGIKSKIDSGLAIQSEADLNVLYQGASLPGSGIKERVDQNLGGINSSSLQQQADQQGLTKSVDTSAKKAYEHQKEQVSGELEGAGSNLSSRETAMQQQADNNKDRSLVKATGYNFLEGIPVVGSFIGESNFKRPDEPETSEAPLQRRDLTGHTLSQNSHSSPVKADDELGSLPNPQTDEQQRVTQTAKASSKEASKFSKDAVPYEKRRHQETRLLPETVLTQQTENNKNHSEPLHYKEKESGATIKHKDFKKGEK